MSKPAPNAVRWPGRSFCGAAVLFALIAAPLSAQTLADTLVRQLQDQGYQNVTVSRTFLGRLRVVADQGGVQREVVVNPRTGEVLRDIQRDLAGNSAAQDRPQILLPERPLPPQDAQGLAPRSPEGSPPAPPENAPPAMGGPSGGPDGHGPGGGRQGGGG